MAEKQIDPLRKERKDKNYGQYPVPCIFPVAKTGKRPLIVEVPGSKSITNRALLLATLASGSSVLKNALFSDDSRHFLACIQELGFETKVNETKREIRVTGLGGSIPKDSASIYVGSAGTAARFLTAYLGVSRGSYRLDASDQMRKRPMAPLLDALKELGCHVTFEEKEGFFPFTLQGNGFKTDHISVDIENSSQFLSALLITACLSSGSMEIGIEKSHGMAYIEMTRSMMEQFGVIAEKKADNCYVVRQNQCYRARDYQIEPDVSAACYFYAMAPLLGIEVIVRNVHFQSLQGDVKFLNILERMGCRVEETPEGILVCGNRDGSFQGIEADLSACSDQAITLAALAPFAEGPTTITGIGHIRYQESDRIHAIAAELCKMGIVCEEKKDQITIFPGRPKKSLVQTYEDHRMAMGFSLTGLRAEGIVIDNPLCCGKTFQEYFHVLDQVMEELTATA